jgi:hypothetical protein
MFNINFGDVYENVKWPFWNKRYIWKGLLPKDYYGGLRVVDPQIQDETMFCKVSEEISI